MAAQPGNRSILSADDCLRAARAAPEPSLALLYYGAAEATGLDDPALCRERDAILQCLGHVELRYLNARCGSWRDPAVLAETLADLEGIQHPTEFPDTVEGFDAANLMQRQEHRLALDICKFLVRRQRQVAYACYMAGCCALYASAQDAAALSWLNMAERFGSEAKYWLNLNRSAVLHRADLLWPALEQMAQLDRDGLADERSLAVSFNIIDELLGATLRSAPDGQRLIKAARSVRDAQSAYFAKIRATPVSAEPASIGRRVFDAASAGNLGIAGDLLHAGDADEIIGDLFAVLSAPGRPPLAVKRTLNLLLSTTLAADGSVLDKALEHGRRLNLRVRAELEFIAGWWRSGDGGSPGFAYDIGRLLAAHLAHSTAVHVIVDEPAVYEFLRGSEIADEVTLAIGPAARRLVSAADTVIALISRAGSVGGISLPPASDLLILLAPGLPGDTVAQIARPGEAAPTRVAPLDLSGWSLWIDRGRRPNRNPSGGWQPAEDDRLPGADDETAARAAKLAADLAGAAESVRPFSYIRLGHAEAHFLGLNRDLPNNALPVRPASFFVAHLGIDPSVLAPEQLGTYQNEFHETCLGADILMTHRGSPGEDVASVIADRVLRTFPGYQTRWPHEVPSSFQAYVLECGAVLPTLADRRVLLIGNPAPRFHELLADTEYRARFKHIGMPQSRINVVKSVFVPHQGDAAFRLLDRLWKEVAIAPFDVALISASLTGKFLAGRIKKYLGRVALDVGFTMQFLASSPSPVAPADIEAGRRRGFTRALPLDLRSAPS